ncbi:MAG: PAS domain S-box protein [Deltaproteobacteria bacterium]|nr:PAS domain S-box protein [Deltaproteobacteria bacterium]
MHSIEDNNISDFLHEQRVNFQKFLDSIKDYLVVFNTQGEILIVNQALLLALGYEREELLAKSITILLPIGDKDALLKLALNIAKEDVPPDSFPLLSKNGRIIPVETSITIGKWEGHSVFFAAIKDLTALQHSQQALQKSEEKWQFATEASAEGIWDWNLKNNTVFFSARWREIRGFEEHELSDSLEEWSTRIHPEERNSVIETVQRHLRGETPFYQSEYRVLCKDGNYKWILDRGKVMEKDARGKPLRVVGTNSDISARRRTEEALKQREAWLSAILNNFPFLVWLKDTEGKFLAVNEAFARSCGCGNASMVIGKTDFDIWPKELAQLYVNDDREVMNRRIKKNVEEPITDEGVTKWFEIFKTPILDEQAKLFGTAGFSRDITGRKIVEEALRESEARYRAVVEDQEELVFRFNTDGLLLFVNDAYCRFFNHNRSELEGHSFTPSIVREDLAMLETIIHDLSANEPVATCRLHVSKDNGQLSMQEWTIRAILNSACQVVEFQAVARDITAQWKAEQQLHYRVDVENLVAHVSSRFINSTAEETAQAIKDSIEQIGSFEGADRVYIFEYSQDGTCMSNTYEWCATGIEPQLDNLQDIPKNSFLWWESKLDKMEIIHISRVSDMPPEATAEKEILQAQDIQSVLVVPLVWKGCVEGFLGFDCVRQEREWSKESIAPMELLANIFIGGLKRKEAEQKLLISQEALKEINNNLEARVVERTQQLQKFQSQLYLQEKLASIGQLATGLAHEINNPVSFVATNFATLAEDISCIQVILEKYKKLITQLAASGICPKEIKDIQRFEEDLSIDYIMKDIDKLVDESKNGFKRITSIIDSMRNFAHVHHLDTYVSYNINKGIEETLVIARNVYKYHADIELNLADVPEVSCLPGQLNQVFLNLIINAAQATAMVKDIRRGLIKIETRFTQDEVFCEISDNGCGISPDIERRIFELFFTTKEPGQGTGLGLSLCYDIVANKHQGKLVVESHAGVGTKFTIALPQRIKEDLQS